MLNLPKGVTYMGVAVVVGLLATFAIQRYIAHKTQPIAPVAESQVVVATADISPGNAVSAAAVTIKSWPQGIVPPQAASSLQQVDGRVAVMPISNGEAVLFSKLAPVGTAAGLSSLLDESKRALTVRVDDVSGVAGFVHPRDKVDILVDMKLQDHSEFFSKTILQNIMVLSVGQTWDTKESKPTIVNTVTMELTPEQAEILNLASSEGKIRLILRGRNNEQIVETKGVAASMLFEGMADLQKAKAEVKPAEAPAPQVKEKEKDERTVEVIKGLERSKVSL